MRGKVNFECNGWFSWDHNIASMDPRTSADLFLNSIQMLPLANFTKKNNISLFKSWFIFSHGSSIVSSGLYDDGLMALQQQMHCWQEKSASSDENQTIDGAYRPSISGNWAEISFLCSPKCRSRQMWGKIAACVMAGLQINVLISHI